MTRPSVERSRRLYDAHATEYDRGIAAIERLLFGDHRGWATARATGTVLELAVGTGLNLPHYGSAATGIVGVDQSSGMLEVARRRVRDTGLGDRVELRLGDVRRLDMADRSVDTVLATYALCSMPDPLVVVREAMRVLRPGGRLVLVEHGVARAAPARTLQHLLQPLSVRLAADDLLGDPAARVRDAGFEVRESDRVGRAGLVHRVVGIRS